LAPWDECAIDLIGPWKIAIQGQEIKLKVLTCIDMTKLVWVENKNCIPHCWQVCKCFACKLSMTELLCAWQWRRICWLGVPGVVATSWNPDIP
jgi:hypothetical protein